MNKIYFKNGYKSGTPIPKVMWWYICENFDKNTHVNAELCNELLNNELKHFFEIYPEELYKSATFSMFSNTSNITDEDIEFYKRELKIDE